MQEYCGEIHMLTVANMIDRPIYVYQTFIRQNGELNYFHPNSDFASLQSLFNLRQEGTLQHIIYTPQSETHNERQALTILFHGEHFTALLKKRPHENLVPLTTCNWRYADKKCNNILGW